MAKFKSKVTFKGEKENTIFTKNKPFEMTVKRAEEVQQNIKEKYGIDLELERLDDKDSKK